MTQVMFFKAKAYKLVPVESDCGMFFCDGCAFDSDDEFITEGCLEADAQGGCAGGVFKEVESQ